MSQEIYWLGITALMTALIWAPYILNRFVEMGLVGAIVDVDADTTPKSAWAKRLMKAHANAIENLVVFSALVVAVELSAMNSKLTALAAMLYFFARLLHVFVYALGVPVLRTVTFLGGFVCQLILALSFLELV